MKQSRSLLMKIIYVFLFMTLSAFLVGYNRENNDSYIGSKENEVKARMKEFESLYQEGTFLYLKVDSLGSELKRKHLELLTHKKNKQ